MNAKAKKVLTTTLGTSMIAFASFQIGREQERTTTKHCGGNPSAIREQVAAGVVAELLASEWIAYDDNSHK